MEEVSSALQSILAHKMRTILTMLGVIIGITSIIAIFSIIEGNTAKMKTELIGGNNNITEIEYNKKSVFDSTIADKKNPVTPNYIPKISGEMMDNIKKQEGVKDILQSYVQQNDLFNGNIKTNATIYVSTNKLLDFKLFDIIKGNKKSDQGFVNQVTYLHELTYNKLYPEDDGLGRYVEINGTPFKVIGVYRNKDEKSRKYGTENSAIIPLSEKSKVFEEIDVAPTFLLQTEKTDQLKTSGQKVASMLNETLPKSDYTYGIRNFKQFEQQLEQFNRSNFILLAGIASISLIVGGIGVMNIMLVSVTERTREIGVKRALGARRIVILRQFLVEAILMTVLGGILGIMLGLISGYLITQYLNYPYIVSYLAVGISLVFCTVIGVVFGLLPAMKASKLDPIEALRFE
ncbi:MULTISPECIES: ABC transporter permease [Vagococcus]|uniref:ABC transporter permease n=1 Tax=Vagococcus TaxID=2737 RepID=UPI000E48BE5D|nr:MULTISPECIES: FtsX-like permease family protein [Vagococcus]RHH66544.1 ABC transporter permease [Vagococcus sp. AM17-17]